MKIDFENDKIICEAIIDALIENAKIIQTQERCHQTNFSRRCVVIYTLTIEELQDPYVHCCTKCIEYYFTNLQLPLTRVSEFVINHYHSMEIFQCNLCDTFISDSKICLKSKQICNEKDRQPILDLEEKVSLNGEMPKFNFN